MGIILFLLLLVGLLDWGFCFDFDTSLHYLQKNNLRDPRAQAQAVTDLISRTLPSHAHYFMVHVDGAYSLGNKDYFELSSEKNNTIKIRGSTGVAAATAFNHYLKYYCNCQIGWQTKQLQMPAKLPAVGLRIVLNDKFRYYQNVCTTSYSFVWWNWDQWEKHIDWIVMNSFNLVLTFNGQEAIWTKVFNEFGLSQDDMNEHFTGPAFLSWLRMGNVRRWGGPLSLYWHHVSVELQKKIVARLRSFGVTTVLPAFAGFIPRAFKRLYPDVDIRRLDNWNRFNDSYCCLHFLDPKADLFRQIGERFIQRLIEVFGTDHVYSCDSFNENTPPSGSLDYLSNVSRSIYSTMTAADPKAIWLMQNWLFVHDALYWTKDRAKALITAVPLDKMIILDLQSEQFPKYKDLDQYFGYPYIWCMLHNFGGTLGMYGSSEIINEEPIIARGLKNSTMIGTGLTMEGINQNYAIYELMAETAWRNRSTNLTTWFSDYATRRYGQKDASIEDAWSKLQQTIYNLKGTRRMRGQYAITRTPNWSMSNWIWYNKTTLIQVLNAFNKSAGRLHTEGFLHDLVDISRQCIQVFNDQIYESMREAFKGNKLPSFQRFSKLFLYMLDTLEKILATNSAFTLDQWVKSARAIGLSRDEKDFYEYNARNQITLWGPKGEIMNYAIKQWSGVVSDFILPRWRLFLEYSNETLISNKRFNQTYIQMKMFQLVEEPFTFKTMETQKEPTESIVEFFKPNKNKWFKILNQYVGIKDFNIESNNGEDGLNDQGSLE